MSQNIVIDYQKNKGLTAWLVAFFISGSFVLLFFNRLFFWFYHPLLVWTDQSVYLEIAQLIWQGQVPYRDIFDFNPPLIMYMSLLPVMLSKIVRIPVALAFSLVVILLNAFSCALSLYLINKRVPAGLPGERPGQSRVVLYCIVFFFALYTQGLDTDLGQREHLFLLLYLPYLIGRGLVWTGDGISRPQSILVGLLAGLGLALKPQFVFCALMAELGFLYRYRQPRNFLRPENAAICGIFAAYALAFFFLPAEARNVFFYKALPIYTWGNEWSLKSLMHMICSESYGLQPFLNFVSAVMLAFVVRNRSPWILPLALFTCTAFFNYFQGAQAWTYRLLPMAFGSYMLYGVVAGLMVDFVLQRWRNQTFVPLLISMAIFFALTYSSVVAALAVVAYSHDSEPFDLTELGLGYFGSNPRPDLSPIFFCIVHNTKPSDYVLHLGTPIAPGFPAILQSGRRSASRYLYCFLVWLEQAREKSGNEAFDRLEKEVIANYGEDILQRRPVLIMVQDLPVEAILTRFNFFEKYMQGYSLIGRAADHSIYKWTGEKTFFATSERNQRIRLVTAILAGQKTIHEVAVENNWPQEKVAAWVEQAQAAVSDALTDRVGARSDELREEIKRLEQRVFDLDRQAVQLKLQIQLLQKK